MPGFASAQQKDRRRQAISSTAKACGVLCIIHAGEPLTSSDARSSTRRVAFLVKVSGALSAGARAGLPSYLARFRRVDRILERTGELGHFWRAKYGNFSRAPKDGPQNRLPGESSPLNPGPSANRAGVRLCTGLGLAALGVVRIVAHCRNLVLWRLPTHARPVFDHDQRHRGALHCFTGQP